MLLHYAASSLAPDKAVPQCLLRKGFVISQNPLGFAQCHDISMPSCTLLSKGNVSAVAKKLEVLFYKTTKKSLKSYLCVAVCCVPLTMCLSGPHSFPKELCGLLLLLREHGSPRDVPWASDFTAIFLVNLLSYLRKRVIVLAKVVFWKWSWWGIFSNIKKKSFLDSHYSLHLGSRFPGMPFSFPSWLLSPYPHFRHPTLSSEAAYCLFLPHLYTGWSVP